MILLVASLTALVSQQVAGIQRGLPVIGAGILTGQPGR